MVSVQDFVESLNFSNLEKEKKDKLMKEYQDILKQLKSKCHHEETNVSYLLEEVKLPKVSSSNKHFPGRNFVIHKSSCKLCFTLAFSSSVEIKFEEKRGRYGVASRNIKLGEVLCVETPSIFYIMPDSESDLCHQSTRYLLEKNITFRLIPFSIEESL